VNVIPAFPRILSPKRKHRADKKPRRVSGLGLATAIDLHKGGAYVSLLDLNEEKGAQVVKELGDRAIFFETDVADTDSVKKAVDGTVEWIKKTGKAIGGVIAAAGVGGARKVRLPLSY
jgi:NAD(P)-dependent dehydrogenase (short-subunit alcohol dehydrogenase family)